MEFFKVVRAVIFTQFLMASLGESYLIIKAQGEVGVLTAFLLMLPLALWLAAEIYVEKRGKNNA